MLNFKILENSNLLITAGNAARQYIKENQKPDVFMIHDLMEWEICNGSFSPFNAGDANPFIGLTSAPAIAECMETDENGKNHIIGQCWYFEPYQVADFCDILKRRGRVIFQKV